MPKVDTNPRKNALPNKPFGLYSTKPNKEKSTTISTAIEESKVEVATSRVNISKEKRLLENILLASPKLPVKVSKAPEEAKKGVENSGQALDKSSEEHPRVAIEKSLERRTAGGARVKNVGDRFSETRSTDIIIGADDMDNESVLDYLNATHNERTKRKRPFKV